jgi:hypothetical protein
MRMSKLIAVFVIFVIICIVALVNEVYESGYGTGYAEAMRNAEELYRKEKADGKNDKSV